MINKESTKDKNILLLDHIEGKVKNFIWDKIPLKTSSEKMKKADGLVSYTVWYDYIKDEVVVTPISETNLYLWEYYKINELNWFKKFYTMGRADFGKAKLNSDYQVLVFPQTLKKLVTFHCPDKDILSEDIQEIIQYSLNWNRAKHLKAEEVPEVDENLSDYYPEVKNIFEQGGLQILSFSNVYGEKSRPIDNTLLMEYYLIKDIEPQSEIVSGMKTLILQQMQELLNTPPMDNKKLTAQLEAMFGLVEISNQFELHPDIKRHLPIRIERKENENSKE
jgi:hypothetical protein